MPPECPALNMVTMPTPTFLALSIAICMAFGPRITARNRHLGLHPRRKHQPDVEGVASPLDLAPAPIVRRPANPTRPLESVESEQLSLGTDPDSPGRRLDPELVPDGERALNLPGTDGGGGEQSLHRLLDREVEPEPLCEQRVVQETPLEPVAIVRDVVPAVRDEQGLGLSEQIQGLETNRGRTLQDDDLTKPARPVRRVDPDARQAPDGRSLLRLDAHALQKGRNARGGDRETGGRRRNGCAGRSEQNRKEELSGPSQRGDVDPEVSSASCISSSSIWRWISASSSSSGSSTSAARYVASASSNRETER